MDYFALTKAVVETALGQRVCTCGHGLMSHNLLRGWCERSGCPCEDFEENA